MRICGRRPLTTVTVTSFLTVVIHRVLRPAILALSLTVTLSAAEPGAKVAFDLPAGDAARRLKEFAQLTKREILYPSEGLDRVQTNAVQGELTVREGLDRLIAGTGLKVFEDPKTGAWMIRSAEAPNGLRAAPSASDRPTASLDGKVVQLDTFEVFGSKSINADLPRTRDDVQPYVVFDRDQLEASPATNLEDFFRARLPMNQQTSAPLSQTTSQTASTVNLRGLGSNQTLILLDGRRLPARAESGVITSSSQADINGIPLSMIERIEVLPSTASGIYGGGATGGVINIITRKDYSGVEVAATYLNTFDTDASTRRVELNGSFQLEGGKTMLTVNASRSDGTSLLIQDRDFLQRARALQLANNRAAFYGVTTPPVGYLPNIRLPSGANLVLKNGTSLNSPITYVPAGYQGPASDGGAALVANAGQYSLDLPNSTGARLSTLLVVPKEEAYSFSLRRKFGRRLEVFVDGSHYENRGESTQVTGVNQSFTLAANAPNNPFTTAVSVNFAVPNLLLENLSVSTSDRLLAGMVVRLPANWTAGADYVWSRSRNELKSAASPLGDPDGTGPGISYTTALSTGALNVLRDLNSSPPDLAPYRMPTPFNNSSFTLESDEITLRGSGPVRTLPAGPMVLSTSAQYRAENTPSSVAGGAQTAVPEPRYTWSPASRLKSRAYYAELQVPVFDEKSTGLLRALVFQLSARRDESEVRARANTITLTVPSPEGPFPSIVYTEREFSATKATAGFKYTPIPDLTIRTSWGSGFIAPNLAQLGSANNTAATFSVIDPKRGNLMVTNSMNVFLGGNPNLNPEESESVSAGFILTPRVLPGFRLSIDYTRITKTDEISSVSPQAIFDNEDRFQGRITRAALTPADQALGYTGGVVQAADFRTMNIAGKRVEAYDFQADYTWKPAWGEIQSYAAATYQTHFSSKLFPEDPYVNQVGHASLLYWRGNAGLTWSRRALKVGWNVQYYESYKIYSLSSTAATIASQVLSQGSPAVPSQVYHDVFVRYQWGARPTGWGRLMSNTQLSVGVQNVFNTTPPILATTSTTSGGYSSLGDPRLSRYTISLRKKL